MERYGRGEGGSTGIPRVLKFDNKSVWVYNTCIESTKGHKMTQFIAKGYIENGDSAVLWRIADYHYQLEVGFGTPRQRSTDLTDTEYYDAFCMLQAICVKEVVVA